MVHDYNSALLGKFRNFPRSRFFEFSTTIVFLRAAYVKLLAYIYIYIYLHTVGERDSSCRNNDIVSLAHNGRGEARFPNPVRN